MPQPLSKVAPNASILLNNMSANPLGKHEHLARLAMEVIVTWSIVESWMLNLYLDLAGGSKSLAAEMFLQMANNSAKTSALIAVLNQLPERERDLCNAIIRLAKIQQKHRDKIAHGVLGFSPNLPDALLFADARALATMSYDDPTRTDHIFVYREREFAEIIQGNRQVASFGFDMRSIVNKSPHNRDDRLYRELCAEPAIRESLDRQGAKGR